MERGFMNNYINAPPEQTPNKINLLGMFHTIELKHKMFRTDSLDLYPILP